MSKYGQSVNGQTNLQIQCMSITQAESEDSAILLACNQSNAKRNKEDCRVVPPRNDNYFTLAPFVAALGRQTAVIGRDTSRCRFATPSAQAPRSSTVCFSQMQPKTQPNADCIPSDLRPMDHFFTSKGRGTVLYW